MRFSYICTTESNKGTIKPHCLCIGILYWYPHIAIDFNQTSGAEGQQDKFWMRLAINVCNLVNISNVHQRQHVFHLNEKLQNFVCFGSVVLWVWSFVALKRLHLLKTATNAHILKLPKTTPHETGSVQTAFYLLWSWPYFWHHGIHAWIFGFKIRCR